MEWKIRITWWIIFCIRYSRLFWIYLWKHTEKTGNPSITLYVNEIEYYLELLTPETKELFGKTKKKTTKDYKNIPYLHLEINKVVLVHSNTVNNDY